MANGSDIFRDDATFFRVDLDVDGRLFANTVVFDSGAWATSAATANLPQIPFGPDGPIYGIEILSYELDIPAFYQVNSQTSKNIRLAVLTQGGGDASNAFVNVALDAGPGAGQTPTADNNFEYPRIYLKINDIEFSNQVVDVYYEETGDSKFNLTIPRIHITGGMVQDDDPAKTFTLKDVFTDEFVLTIDADNTEIQYQQFVDLRDDAGNGFLTLSPQLTLVSGTMNLAGGITSGGLMNPNAMGCTVYCKYKKLSRNDYEALAIRQATTSF